MKIYFGQIYVEVGASFPFTIFFQKYLSERITLLVLPSDEFLRDYGENWELMIRISAKATIFENEIKGPTVFRKDKDVEYTIFLPFDIIQSNNELAVEYLIQGTIEVLDDMNIVTNDISNAQAEIIEHVITDPRMVNELPPL